MDSTLFELAAANGIWAVLFVGLFLYQLRDSKFREKKYQHTIENLAQSVSAINEIKEDIEKLSGEVSEIARATIKYKKGVLYEKVVRKNEEEKLLD